MPVVCRTGMRAATEDKSASVADSTPLSPLYPVPVCVYMHVCVAFALRDSVIVCKHSVPNNLCHGPENTGNSEQAVCRLDFIIMGSVSLVTGNTSCKW